MPLQPLLPDFPFSKWGLDFIGSINPPSLAGQVFILIATYYFTKWDEFVPLKHSTDDQVISFLENNIFPDLVFHWKLLQTMVPLSFLLR
jgi:hypothetical protein